MEVDFSLLLAVFLQHLLQLLNAVIANKSHCWRVYWIWLERLLEVGQVVKYWENFASASSCDL